MFRHGESVMNTQLHLIGGRSNETPLTETGILQSKRLGAFLLENGIFPDYVHASPAVRTLETARYSLQAMGVEIEPVINDGIQELDQGKWVGRERIEIYTDDMLAEIKRLGKDFKGDGGESMNDVGERMLSRLLGQFEGYIPLKKPERHFVYTHGVAIRCLVSKILDWSQKQTYETQTDNTSMTLMVRRGGQWALEYLGKMPE